MEFGFKIGEVSYCFEHSVYHDLAIPLHFDGPQPGAFGVEPASGGAYRSGSFIGDVSEGGSCNFEKLSLVPHCNGTHTECLGHITSAKFSIREQLRDTLLPATLISVEASPALGLKESYRPEMGPKDRVISKKALEMALSRSEVGFLKALVIRTLPNTKEKCSRNYQDVPAPYFTVEAMIYLGEMGVEHLLVDLPSIDRSDDEGKLTNHHLFWNMKEGSHETDESTQGTKTITEFIYAHNEVNDGIYMLNLQIAPFESDAAPSRPLLFKVRRQE